METRRGPRPLAPGTRGKAPGAEAAACREVAGMRASAHFPPASERVLLGSAGRPYSPSIAELCRDGAPPSCRGPYGEHGGGSAASPRCSPASRAVPPLRRASVLKRSVREWKSQACRRVATPPRDASRLRHFVTASFANTPHRAANGGACRGVPANVLLLLACALWASPRIVLVAPL